MLIFIIYPLLKTKNMSNDYLAELVAELSDRVDGLENQLAAFKKESQENVKKIKASIDDLESRVDDLE